MRKKKETVQEVKREDIPSPYNINAPEERHLTFEQTIARAVTILDSKEQPALAATLSDAGKFTPKQVAVLQELGRVMRTKLATAFIGYRSSTGNTDVLSKFGQNVYKNVVAAYSTLIEELLDESEDVFQHIKLFIPIDMVQVSPSVIYSLEGEGMSFSDEQKEVLKRFVKATMRQLITEAHVSEGKTEDESITRMFQVVCTASALISSVLLHVDSVVTDE